MSLRRLCLALVLVLGLVPSQPSSAAVTVPDQGLRACMNAAVGNPATAAPTAAQLRSLTTFDCHSAGVKNLAGLEQMVNLTELRLYDNDLAAARLPAGLTKLTLVDLSDNALTSLSVPSTWTALRDLLAAKNQLTSVSLPTTVRQLKRVDLNLNALSDLGPIAWLPDSTFVSASDQRVVLPPTIVGRSTAVVLRDHLGRALRPTLTSGSSWANSRLTFSITGQQRLAFTSGYLTNGVHQGELVQQVSPAGTSGATGDHTGDKTADVYSTDSAGRLHFYTGSRTGPLTYAGPIGGGWNAMTYLAQVADVNGDRYSDLMVRRGSDHSLWLYRGIGGGPVSTWRQIGKNWGAMNQIVPAGNLVGGSAQFVVARRSDGTLHRYQLTATGLKGRKQIGWNWNGMRQITSIGDLNGDGRSDVVAVRADGTLWLYHATASGTLAAGRQVGKGWTGFTHVWSAGDISGDGRPDLFGRRLDGNIYVYSYNRSGSSGGFSAARLIGEGFGDSRLLG